MKYGLIFLILPALLLSCSQEESSQQIEGEPEGKLVGKWQLFEILMDPGDGSGVFQVVSSDRTIEFLGDGSFVSNYSLCLTDSDSDEETMGTYDQNKSILVPSECEFPGSDAKFEIPYYFKESNLVVGFPPCIEPCAQKFKRVK